MSETQSSPSEHESDPKQGFPWQMGVSLLGWIGLFVVLLTVGLGGGSGSGGDADSASVGSIRESLGTSYAPAGSGNASPVLITLAAFVVFVLTVLLLVRQGWARHTLTVVGVVVVIMLAAFGRWEAVLAMAALVVGALPLVSRAASRYLA